MSESGYTLDARQFNDAEITLVEVWAQLVEPGLGEHVLGSGSQAKTVVFVAERHITRRRDVGD